jgi:hypothetical protein
MTMTILAINVSTVNQKVVCMPTTACEGGSTLLAEAELDHIAAAGSKPGISGGSGATVDRPRPPLPK